MPTSHLDGLAQAHGISLAYIDASGEVRPASEAAKAGLLKALGISLNDTSRSASAESAAAPLLQSPTPTAARNAYLPAWLEKDRAWGVTCQLYSIRSSRNEGIGDFEDLARLAELLARQGADFLGVNPMHALFLSDPKRFSPYSPSSRRFVTPMYIATDRLADSITRTNMDEAPSDTGLVDYARVLARKRQVLETAFDTFRRCEFGTGSPLDIGFGAFRDRHGQALEDFAIFEALSESQVAVGRSSGWLGWPTELRRRASAAVAAFATAHPERILFHTWLQWIADRQLAEAQRRAVAAGMRIGLYLDIAVGVAPDGADTWCAPDEVLATARIGAPPDAFNMRGQDWGLAPISPRALSAGKSSTFRSVIASAMQNAGAVRLDHAMSLTRLYLIPEGHGARDGAYVAYPLDELLDVICEVSAERRVIVIGEDLGTVPDGFREAAGTRGIQGYRVLIFERTTAGFRPPRAYDREALACIGTHDLPTLFAWWRGSDIDDRAGLGILTPEEATAAREFRARERTELIALLATEGLLTADVQPSRGAGAEALPLQPDVISIPIHSLLARTRCHLAAVQLEDLVGFEGCMNIPGTVDEHPNWRQKLPVALEEISDLPHFVSLCAVMRKERPQKP